MQVGPRYKIWLTQNLKDKKYGGSPQGVQPNDDVQAYTATDLNRPAMHFKGQKKIIIEKRFTIKSIKSRTFGNANQFMCRQK